MGDIRPTATYAVAGGRSYPLPLSGGTTVDVQVRVGQAVTVSFAGECAAGRLLFNEVPPGSHRFKPVGREGAATYVFVPKVRGVSALAVAWTACSGWMSCPAPRTLREITVHAT
jgi:hypothetical protein